MRRFRLLTAIGALLLVVALVTGATVRAQEPPNGVRVRGEGAVTAAPDTATLNIGATVRRDTPAEAYDRTQQAAETLYRMFVDNGVQARDIQTAQLSLFPEYGGPVPAGQSGPTIAGWRGAQSFTVKVRDFARIGPILDASVRLLGQDAQIQGVYFATEDTDALIARARAEAFANAREAAEELARLAGARLGEVISMEETFTPSPTPVQASFPAPSPVPRPALPAPGGPIPSPVPQVAPGQVSVRVFVTIVFALERPPRT